MSDEQRRLAAVMFTDVVGYSSLTQKNERLALELLEEHRKIVRPIVARHNGREIKTMGDAFLIEFESALEATQCAVDVQKNLYDHNQGSRVERQIHLRIGIHLGDVEQRQSDVLADAANIASRIEPLAESDGIKASRSFLCVCAHQETRRRRKLLPSSSARQMTFLLELHTLSNRVLV